MYVCMYVCLYVCFVELLSLCITLGLCDRVNKMRRRVLRDNIYGITNTALRRLVKRIDSRTQISEFFYEELRGVTKLWLEQVIRAAFIFMEKSKSIGRPTRVRVAHILAALKHAPGNHSTRCLTFSICCRRRTPVFCTGIRKVHDALASCRRQWLRAIWKSTSNKAGVIAKTAKDLSPHAELLAFFASFPGSITLIVDNRHMHAYPSAHR